LIRVILKAAGNDVEKAYNVDCENNPHAMLTSTISGCLPCKRIFFLKWKPDKDEVKLRQSLIDLIRTVMQELESNHFTSIAFPAIGCGQHGCSVNLVVKTMVNEMKQILLTRNLRTTVKFVIQSNQQNVYDEFCKQLLKTRDGKFMMFLFEKECLNPLTEQIILVNQ
jgi:hypothetical protein